MGPGGEDKLTHVEHDFFTGIRIASPGDRHQFRLLSDRRPQRLPPDAARHYAGHRNSGRVLSRRAYGARQATSGLNSPPRGCTPTLLETVIRTTTHNGLPHSLEHVQFQQLSHCGIVQHYGLVEAITGLP